MALPRRTGSTGHSSPSSTIPRPARRLHHGAGGVPPGAGAHHHHLDGGRRCGRQPVRLPAGAAGQRRRLGAGLKKGADRSSVDTIPKGRRRPIGSGPTTGTAVRLHHQPPPDRGPTTTRPRSPAPFRRSRRQGHAGFVVPTGGGRRGRRGHRHRAGGRPGQGSYAVTLGQGRTSSRSPASTSCRSSTGRGR